jgi:hypothetical protein
VAVQLTAGNRELHTVVMGMERAFGTEVPSNEVMLRDEVGQYSDLEGGHH